MPVYHIENRTHHEEPGAFADRIFREVNRKEYPLLCLDDATLYELIHCLRLLIEAVEESVQWLGGDGLTVECPATERERRQLRQVEQEIVRRWTGGLRVPFCGMCHGPVGSCHGVECGAKKV